MINLLSMVDSRKALWRRPHRRFTSEDGQSSPGRADSSHMCKSNSSGSHACGRAEYFWRAERETIEETEEYAGTKPWETLFPFNGSWSLFNTSMIL